jgi:hypothetical protein
MTRRRRLTPEQVRRVLAPPPPEGLFGIGRTFDFGLARSEKPEPEKRLARVIPLRKAGKVGSE